MKFSPVISRSSQRRYPPFVRVGHILISPPISLQELDITAVPSLQRTERQDAYTEAAILAPVRVCELRRTCDDDDAADVDDDVVLYSAVTPCCCNMIGALGRVVSFEACCQRALLSVQILRHYPTI